MHDDANLDGAELKAILEGHSKSFRNIISKVLPRIVWLLYGYSG